MNCDLRDSTDFITVYILLSEFMHFSYPLDEQLIEGKDYTEQLKQMDTVIRLRRTIETSKNGVKSGSVKEKVNQG